LTSQLLWPLRYSSTSSNACHNLRGGEHPDWYNGFEHDPEEAVRVRVSLLRELAVNRESLVATHLSFPSVCHVAVDGDVFRWVPGLWEY
jgi:hypothetical protein